MESVNLVTPVTLKNFEETAYLAINPDVRAAIKAGHHDSGRAHFRKYGQYEKRFQLSGGIPPEWKMEKLEFLKKNILPERGYKEREFGLDFLHTESGRDIPDAKWEEESISDWGYDHRLSKLLNTYPRGWVLDCGAGWRKRYYRYIINLEILPFPSTDVLASGDALPFEEDSFDMVISSSVLEHVPDPFRCAGELSRVLKPGGVLFCSVPFLQPYHGYPHHYYNMTAEGLKNLFEKELEVKASLVYGTLRPLSSLCWILGSWAEGLKGEARKAFLDMRVEDFLKGRDAWMDAPFVEALTDEKNKELAAGTVLIARKPERAS